MIRPEDLQGSTHCPVCKHPLARCTCRLVDTGEFPLVVVDLDKPAEQDTQEEVIS